MEIKQLKYFLEVAKREHLSEAALELNIAQSAISRQMNQLEQELKVKLFKRQGRNIRLTKEGKALVIQASNILNQLDETIMSFQQQQSTNYRQIKLGYEKGYLSQIILPLVKTFDSSCQSIALPQLLNQEDVLSHTLEGIIDVGLTEATSNLKQYHDLEVIPLFEETYHLYVPKNDPLALTMNPPLIQLENTHLYIMDELPKSIYKQLNKHINVELNIINEKQLAEYLLKNERGYILVPDYLHLEKQPNHYVRISLQHTDLKRAFCAIIKKEHTKPDIDTIVDLIQSRFSKVTTYH